MSTEISVFFVLQKIIPGLSFWWSSPFTRSFVLILLGDLQVLEDAPGAIPVRVLGRLGGDADAEPVVPVVALVTADHRGAVILSTTRRTYPDLKI